MATFGEVAPSSVWEVFDARTARRGAMEVRIKPTGAITLGSAVVALLGNAEHVELLFDRRGQRIGIRAATGPQTFKLTSFKTSGQRIFSARQFLLHYNLLADGKPFSAVAKLEGDVLVVPLKGSTAS